MTRQPAADHRLDRRDFLRATPTADEVADLSWAVVMLPEFQLVR